MQKLDLPITWVWATVSDLGKVVSGGTPSTKEPTYWGGDVAWISPSDLTGYSSKFISKGAKSITQVGVHNSSATVMPAGSIHFSSRAPIGYTVISACGISTNQGFKSLVPATGVFNEYIYYYFKSAKQLAESLATGTTFKEISGSAFSKMLVPLPPAAEQHRIVTKVEELFSELDKGVENLRTAQQQLKVYRQALLKHAFEGKLTADWRAQNPDKLESADAMLTRIQQEREAGYQRQLKDWQAAQRAWEANGKMGSKPSKPKAPKALPSLTAEKLPNNWITLPIDLIFEIEDGDRGEHYPTKGDFSNVGHCLFLNAKNVTKRGFLFKETSFISEKKHQALRKGSLKRGDIIFTSRGTLGNIAIYNEKTPYEHVRINSGMFIIRNYSDIFLPDFIYRYLTSPDIISQIDKLQSGTAQPQLPIREFKSFRFVFPGKPEQEQITLVIEEKLSLLDQLEQTITHCLQQAEALRQSILKKAFSGQLVAQDPNDEPASVLLERIRAERAAQPKARGRKTKASA